LTDAVKDLLQQVFEVKSFGLGFLGCADRSGRNAVHTTATTVEDDDRAAEPEDRIAKDNILAN
jgi:hypothetical protein